MTEETAKIAGLFVDEAAKQEFVTYVNEQNLVEQKRPNFLLDEIIEDCTFETMPEQFNIVGKFAFINNRITIVDDNLKVIQLI